MESVHILAPVGIGAILTIVGLMDEVILGWKLESFLATQPDAVRQTVTNLVFGAVSLVSFFANSLIFIVNLLLALSLYEGIWIRYVVSLLILVCFVVQFYAAAALSARYDIVDIAELKFRGRFIRDWLWWGQFAYNIIAFVLLLTGLVLPREPAHAAAEVPVRPAADIQVALPVQARGTLPLVDLERSIALQFRPEIQIHLSGGFPDSLGSARLPDLTVAGYSVRGTNFNQNWPPCLADNHPAWHSRGGPH
jgi:hypothetical protein